VLSGGGLVFGPALETGIILPLPQAETQAPLRKAWNYSNSIGRDACVHKLFDGSGYARLPSIEEPKGRFSEGQ
jgi:hypothetical protein